MSIATGRSSLDKGMDTMLSSDDSSHGVLVSTKALPEDQISSQELDRPSQPTDQSQPLLPRLLGNPAPLGLCAFGLTCFTSSAITVRATEVVKLPDAVTASALAYGGFVQILVGMWELARGNTFNATSFCSYGAYWVTSSLITVLGKIESWMDPGHRQSEDSMGLFMIAWFILTTLFLLCTLKTSVAQFFLFFSLDMNFLLLGITYLQPNAPDSAIISIQRTGGIFGLLAALAAWYNALAEIVNPVNSFFTLPLGYFPWSLADRRQQLKSDEKLT